MTSIYCVSFVVELINRDNAIGCANVKSASKIVFFSFFLSCFRLSADSVHLSNLKTGASVLQRRRATIHNDLLVETRCVCTSAFKILRERSLESFGRVLIPVQHQLFCVLNIVSNGLLKALKGYLLKRLSRKPTHSLSQFHCHRKLVVSIEGGDEIDVSLSSKFTTALYSLIAGNLIITPIDLVRARNNRDVLKRSSVSRPFTTATA